MKDTNLSLVTRYVCHILAKLHFVDSNFTLADIDKTIVLNIC